MKKKIETLVAVVAIIALIVAIGSAANYVYIESNVKGVGYKNSMYEVDTEPGVASGIEMREVESGSGLVTSQKWTLEVNPAYGSESGDTAASAQTSLGIMNTKPTPKPTPTPTPTEPPHCGCGIDERKVVDYEYFPITYQNLSYDQKWLEKKCVKNYVIGAVTDAYFDMCERLEKEETVVTYTGDSPLAERALTQTVTADVLGRSHIGFAAKESNGNHRTIAMGVEETVGDFHIEKTIDIRETCNESMIGDWLGCP